MPTAQESTNFSYYCEKLVPSSQLLHQESSKKNIESILDDLSLIAGQKAVLTKAKPLLSVVLAEVKVTAPPTSLEIPADAPPSAIDVDHSAEGNVL